LKTGMKDPAPVFFVYDITRCAVISDAAVYEIEPNAMLADILSKNLPYVQPQT
jgi:hypothetical protein